MKTKKDEQALKDFVAESEDLLEELGKDLIELEESMKTSAVKPDLINKIFRSMHSLKGLSGMLSLKNISELAHELEDMLDELRMGKINLNSEILDVLFEGLDILNKLVEEASKGEENFDISDVMCSISNVLTKKVVKDSGLGISNIEIDDKVLKTFTEYEEHRLMENITNGLNLFEIEVSFEFETFDKDITSISESLKSVGEIISTLPSSGTTSSNRISFNLILGTIEDVEVVKSKIAIKEHKIRKIGYSKELMKEEREEEKAKDIEEPTETEESEESDEVKKSKKSSSTIRSLSQTVRVDIQRLDNLMNTVGELVLNKTNINQLSKELTGLQGFTGIAVELNKAARVLDRRLKELQNGVIEARMIPIGQIFSKLNRIVRKLSIEANKDIDLQISGGETELDKLVVEDIADPLMHLIRNAIDHGIESPKDRKKAGKPKKGVIRLEAMQKGNHVVIEVEDDGAGIDIDKIKDVAIKKGLLEKNAKKDDQQIFEIMFLPGFSTSEKVSEVSGRGVGLDVVKKNISNLSGMINIETEIGKGTKFVITLPITLAIIQALLVGACDQTYAIPLNSVLESLKISPDEIKTVEKREVIEIRDSTLSLLRLKDVFNLTPKEVVEQETSKKTNKLYVVVTGLAEKRVGLVVDNLKGQQEIVIKSIGEILKDVPGIAGATELGDKKAILVLDVGSLIEEATAKF